MGIHFRPRYETQLRSNLSQETETQVTVCNPRSLRHYRYTRAHFSESQLFTMSANFVGKYQRTSAEKYEEFLTALGVNFLLRKAATVSTPVTEEGGNWTIKTSTTLKSMELKFKLDEEFEETTPDGREVKSVVKMEGNKLVAVQTAKKDGEKSTKSVREFNG